MKIKKIKDQKDEYCVKILKYIFWETLDSYHIKKLYLSKLLSLFQINVENRNSVQINLLNLCVCVVNLQSLFCSRFCYFCKSNQKLNIYCA